MRRALDIPGTQDAIEPKRGALSAASGMAAAGALIAYVADHSSLVDRIVEQIRSVYNSRKTVPNADYGVQMWIDSSACIHRVLRLGFQNDSDDARTTKK